MKTKLNTNKVTAIALTILLLAVGAFAGCANPNETAQKAVDGLYANEEKLLAEDVNEEKIETAKDAITKVTDEELKKEMTEKAEMAEKMYTLKTKADSMYTIEDTKVYANEKMEKKDWDEIKKQSETLKKDKKDEFVKSIDTELADAKNYFDSKTKIDSLYSDGAKRKTMKDDAKKATYDEAIKIADKIKSEEIKKQAKDGSDKIKKAVEAKEADRKAKEEQAIASGSGYRDDSGNYVAYTEAEIAANSGGGYYEESYSGGSGGGYYEESYDYGSSDGGYGGGSSGGGDWTYTDTPYYNEDGSEGGYNRSYDEQEWGGGSVTLPGGQEFDPGTIGW